MRDDEVIAEEIRRGVILRTLWIPDTVEVTDEDGVVTLAGEVDSASRRRARRRARPRVPGVVAVDSEVTTIGEGERRFHPRLVPPGSNSVVSWLIVRSGLSIDAVCLPANGRAPWRAGAIVAKRHDEAPPKPERGGSRPLGQYLSRIAGASPIYRPGTARLTERSPPCLHLNDPRLHAELAQGRELSPRSRRTCRPFTACRALQ